MTVRVLYARPDDQPWHVITVMARMCAELLDADLREVTGRLGVSTARRATAVLPRRRGRRDSEPNALVVIAPQPVDLQNVLLAGHPWRGYDAIVAWVVDSWWTDRAPFVARGRGHFDRLYVSEAELVQEWQHISGAEVSWLRQGTNALDWGSSAAQRQADLIIVGRRPDAWQDLERVAGALRARGLRLAQTPPLGDDPVASMRALLAAQARAKFSLAFDNLASPTRYTHPTRAYVTGRWTDSLGAGCVVAGRAPRTRSADFWPGALLPLSPDDLEAAVDVLAEAAASWSPEVAVRNHVGALEELDWRWRIKQIADDLGVSSERLDHELARLRSRVDSLRRHDTGGQPTTPSPGEAPQPRVGDR